MELDYALLCDAAQISQGKTFILGGGVTILWRQEYPAPLGISIALQLSYHRTEADTDHELRLQVIDADGNPVLPEMGASFHVGGALPGVPGNVPLAAPVALPFPPLPALQRPGAYS